MQTVLKQNIKRVTGKIKTILQITFCHSLVRIGCFNNIAEAFYLNKMAISKQLGDFCPLGWVFRKEKLEKQEKNLVVALRLSLIDIAISAKFQDNLILIKKFKIYQKQFESNQKSSKPSWFNLK